MSGSSVALSSFPFTSAPSPPRVVRLWDGSGGLPSLTDAPLRGNTALRPCRPPCGGLLGLPAPSARAHTRVRFTYTHLVTHPHMYTAVHIQSYTASTLYFCPNPSQPPWSGRAGNLAECGEIPGSGPKDSKNATRQGGGASFLTRGRSFWSDRAHRGTRRRRRRPRVAAEWIKITRVVTIRALGLYYYKQSAARKPFWNSQEVCENSGSARARGPAGPAEGPRQAQASL